MQSDLRDSETISACSNGRQDWLWRCSIRRHSGKEQQAKLPYKVVVAEHDEDCCAVGLCDQSLWSRTRRIGATGSRWRDQTQRVSSAYTQSFVTMTLVRLNYYACLGSSEVS